MNESKNLFLKLSLLLALCVGWSSGAWAQNVTQLPLQSGVYEILNISNESGAGTGRGYLVSFTQHNSGIGLADCTYGNYRNSHPLERNNGSTTCSYWYLHNHGDNTYTLVSISTLGGNTEPRFLTVGPSGDKSRIATTPETRLIFKDTNTANHNRDGKKAVNIANQAAPNVYLSGGCGTPSTSGSMMATTTASDGGCPWLFIPVTTTIDAGQQAIIDKYLLRFTKLPDNTNLVFQDTEGNLITSSSKLVKYTPAGGGAAEYLTSANSTHNFGNVLYNPAAFSSTFDYWLKGVSFDKTTNTLTFTLAFNKWYIMKVANNNSYVSSDYADANGMRLASGQARPDNYAGIWRSGDAGGEALNSNGHNVSLYNAKYYDTKLLAMTNPANDGRSRGAMYASNEVPAGAATIYEQRVNPSQADSYYFRITGNGVNTNTYINLRDPYFSNWTGGGYGGSGSQFVIEEVPNLGEDVKVIVNAPDGVSILYNTQCEAYNSVFGVSATNVVMSSQDHYNFHNMPFLESLFRLEGANSSKTLSVNFNANSQTLTLSVVEDPNTLTLSPAPTADGWAEGTKWFTIHNNKSVKGYLSTQDSGSYLDSADKLTIQNNADARGNRGGLWAFVAQDGGGFYIYNNAYGPDYILGVAGSNADARLSMYHKGQVPSNVKTLFTHGENSQRDSGTSHAYYFQIDLTGNKHLNHQGAGYPAIWDSGNKTSDIGSAFTVTAIEDAHINALTQYDVYTVARKGAPDDCDVTYKTAANVFGRKGHAYNGSTIILAKNSPVTLSDFTSSSTDYTLQSVTVKSQDGHHCRLLEIRLRDVLATEAYRVVVKGVTTDNLVTYNGDEYHNGEQFYVRPNHTPKTINFDIVGADNHFVWGPVIDSRAKTVTYDVRERASSLESGWYQMQLADDNYAQSVIDQINEEDGNVNTRSHTVYAAPIYYDALGAKMKFTGVPRYGAEATTFVYVESVSGTQLKLHTPSGKVLGPYNYRFENNQLKLAGWSVGSENPLENPVLSVSGSNYTLPFNLNAVNSSAYKIYQINFTGDVTASSAVNYTGASNQGAGAIYNNGYLFLPSNGNAPRAEQFTVVGGNARINTCTVGVPNEATGIIPVTLDLASAKESWKVKITGYGLVGDEDKTYHVTYNGHDYENGDLIEVKLGTEIDPTALKISCTNQFVWGPIIRRATSDDELNFVEFEIREAATTLEAGAWYQFQLSPTADGTYYNSSNQTQNGNLVEGALRYNPRNAGSQIYLTGANKTSNWTVELMGMPQNEAETYLYIKDRTGNNTQMMMQNGYYITDQSQSSSSPSNSNIEFITTNNQFHWKNSVFPWQGLNGMNMALGKAGSATGSVKFIAHKVNTTAYKIVLNGLSGGSVRYIGSADLLSDRNFVNNSYIFLKEGENFEQDGSNAIDISNFVVRGSNATITSITTSTSGDITTLTIQGSAPNYDNVIVHKQNRYYDHLETDSNKPVAGFIVDGEGWTERTGTDNVKIREQNTSVYEIPVYLKQGTSMISYLPTNQIASYQRWYNWDTDGQVDETVLTNTYYQPKGGARSTIGLDSYRKFKNGYAVFRGAQNSDDEAYFPELTLPSTMEKYNVGLDISRFTDYNTGVTTESAIEPSLGMRIVYQVRDAKLIANAIKTASDAEKFYEVHDIALPNVQYGSRADRLEDRTLSTTLPLDMDLNNYWGFNSGGTGNDNLVQLTQDSQLRVELVDGGSNIKNYMMIPGSATDNSGKISRTSFNTGHFVLFQYPDNGYIEPNATATINVYMTSDDREYKLVQFNLTFIPNSAPTIVTELKNSNRHPDALAEEFGFPVAELTFDQTPNTEYSTTENGVAYPDYRYPLDYKGASYAFGARNGRSWAASRGEYGLQSFAGTSGQTGTPRMVYYPVVNYLQSMADANTALGGSRKEGAYQLYIDAADQPGKIASIALNEPLCPGSRLYCYGYIGCTSGGTGQHPTSVLINVMGNYWDDEAQKYKEELIYSYCPGIITLRGYAEDGRTVYSTLMGNSSSYSIRTGNEDRKYWAPWQQIGFSFTISSNVAKKMSSYSIQIMNNAYNSNGGDTMLDDFSIYVKPPKGVVNFTTPLCSDKVRHAKLHADYDTLKELVAAQGSANSELAVSYCFLEADVFDNYTDENGVSIKDVFEVDDQGNHNVKIEMTPAIESLINNAFGAALVGSRRDKNMPSANADYSDDFGFHSFNIPLDYSSIPEYAYNDSKNDIVYREEVDGVHRIVFKEDVVRGEMLQRQDTDGHYYWPHMRPSTEYYLVFAPMKVDEGHIALHNVATQIFSMQNTCSFLGKFTTKDPMHVILDNAEIESDLPITAVCYDEKKEFHFDMPALKLDKPIVDEAYCISDESLNGKVVPSTQGANHYKYEASFNNDDVYGVIKNLPYDWWMGGTLGDTKYRGTIDEYLTATHPTRTYSGPKDIAHKQDHAPVNIAQAMTDFRFFYPDFGKSGGELDWSTVTRKDYNNDTGYGLLDSEIQTIKDFVDAKIILLHRNTYDMPLTYKEAEELQAQEVNDLTEEEMSNRILQLALKLNEDESIASSLPLKAIEGTVLNMISSVGRQQLTLEELGSFTHEQLKGIATALKTNGKLTDVTTEQIDAMSEGDLRRAVENALKAMADDEMQTFASNESNFPNIGHEKRAYLVVRALDILSRETVADLMKEKPNATSDEIRAALRAKMIELFSKQKPVVLRKMWADASAELTEAERITLLTVKGEDGEPATILNPAEMDDAAKLAVLVEDALAKIVNNVIADMKSDRYIHFTLVPIMPSQENFVDEPYIFCPDPRGVKLRITNKKPQMFDGFADMPYPDKMDNVPVRIGLQQIDAVPYSDANDAKTLRIPLRRLSRAQADGTLDQFEVNERGYGRYLFLVETNDPAYKREGATAAADGLTKAELLPVDDPKKDYPADEDDEFGRHHLIGMVSDLQASYDKEDNYMNILFNSDFKFREGYTYRVGFNFVESKSKTDAETGEVVYERNQSCFGTMLFDIKIVPEYQKWTGAVSDDWTNDANWQRADRSDLHADNLPTGEVITGSTAYAKATATDGEAAKRYPTNETNETAESFIPMAFTNTLIAEGASVMPQLYNVTPAHHPYKDSDDNVVEGAFVVLNTTTASDKAKYDMEVYDATGAWHTADNYECGLFGTYVAKGITFEPATSLYNAQLLSYQKAWVEYSLNANRWYTIASPLQETYSGEWYSPTGSGDGKGKQLTPHFYDINYDVELNDRFNPAYYQRSWDKGTANMFRCFDKSHDPSTYYLPTVNPLNVAIGLDWSHVYNDVEVDYSNGGFSVKPAFGDDSEGEVLVRMPKDDASYNYYDKGNEEATNVHPSNPPTYITRDAGHHRLISDMLATAENFTQSITNANGDKNPYYLVANPFMAPMDMDEFFAENTQFEAGKFWIMADNLQKVNVKSDNGWISTTGDNAVGTVAPLQAFFVKLSDPTKEAVTVTYNAAMQKQLVADESRPVLKAPAQQSSSSSSLSSSLSLILHIEATDADGALQSQAAVVFSETADNAFRAGEDAELLLDGNTAEEIATVFTAAPTTETDEAQAMQFNALSRTVTTIPVGVIAPTDETETTLTFTGVTALTDVMAEAPYLYDAANGSFTALDEESTLTVTGTSSGRYFIVSGMHIPYDNADDNDNGEALKSYNLHGIRVASPQRGTVTIRGSRKEFNR